MKKTKLTAKTSLKKHKSKQLRPWRSKRKDKVAADLARAIWRLHGKCENCYAKPPKQLQGAHLIGTGASISLCSDLRNGFCLCASCHRYFTSDPVAFNEFIMGSWAEKYIKTLRRLQKESRKQDWDDRIDFLKEIKRAIEAGEMTIAESREYEQS
jgi:HNH endonuclease